MNVRTWTIAMALAGAVGLVSLGCDFVFSYKSITAPVGTWGEVGIRVYKTHANCTLPSPYAYDITTAGVQILDETPWNEVQPNVIEKWVILSLAEVGDGLLKISKTCTKEGYEEGILPIRVTAPTADGAWFQAWSGTYPFESPVGYTLASVVGDASLNGDVLSVGGVSLALPTVPQMLAGRTVSVRLFYVMRDGKPFPLLIVGEGLFWRYDALLSADE
ncbi:MAG: hypothetical protein BIP78_0113 [Candidatus Bipolaricaulis sibiricus]|uniref:Uncharacterized protein n=1 Tax=Bipolaricaulis sibiricus TaxID=2501609 RepID=A0A410FSD9_BIPS1|nr:MAG: hypothetical protein BIP78_0113 [Candidatus Bipolaricaulis sibiricus]